MRNSGERRLSIKETIFLFLTFVVEFFILSIYWRIFFLKDQCEPMPIYEYRCDDCRKRSSLLLRSFQEKVRPICPFCGSRKLRRIFSRFAMVRSEEDRLERLADPSKWAGLNENDPKSMIQWAKRMGKEMGDEMGENVDQMMEEELEKEATSSDNEPPEE